MPKVNTNKKKGTTNNSKNKNSTNTSTKKSSVEAFLSVARSQVGTKEVGNTNNVKYNTWYYGHAVSGEKTYAWCAVFVSWCAHKAFNNNKIIPKNASAHDVQAQIVSKCGGGWVLKRPFNKSAGNAAKCKPGDIFTTDPGGNGVSDHVGIIESVNGTKFTTIEGNNGNQVKRTTRSIDEIFRVARPKWPDGTYSVSLTGDYSEDGTDGVSGESGEYGSEYGTPDTAKLASPEQLYSSDNYKYVDDATKEEVASYRLIKERQQSIKTFLASIGSVIEDIAAVPDIVLSSISSTSQSVSNFKKPRTKVEGDAAGSILPSTTNYVEAPYVKLTIGGVEIGTYKKGNYPNYIQGINVKKTNGSLNEYTIQLIHQIAPGDNPNYIDNLISANGYNKIKIEYGDAEAGVSYQDVNALLIDVQSKFDFFNNCINYTLRATSSSVMSVIDRRNYPAVLDKPSNIINKMLYETKELLQYFPGMQNRSFANSKNLIPSNDKKVNIDAVENTTPLNYMNKLVSSMVSETSKSKNDSIYYLNIFDEDEIGPYFKISQINTGLNSSMFPLIYEVDINYPNEKSLVYNFSVNTDYAWPLAYEYAGSVPTYNYNINNAGDIIRQNSTANIKQTKSTSNKFISDKNWWTNVTEFPISATLEVKGLTSYILLLNYIKINVFYFGNKRDSSGTYIVVGQEDTLSGNGFRTKLDLLRVAGDNQYITVDGRVITQGS